MTDEKEGPVHYQVSVTGRQAAAFFLVLLAALGLSFFFGMKTGAAARRGPDAVAAIAAQSDIPLPRPSGEGEAGERATPVPTEVPIGFEPAARPREAAPRSEPAPRADVPEPPTREEPRPVVSEVAPTATPKPTAAPPKAAAPAASPAPQKPAGKPSSSDDAGPFWVQVLVTRSAEKADALAKKLKADGFRPDVSLVPGNQGLFRVRVGPYADRAKADAGAKRVEKLEKLEATIVPAGK